MEKPENHRSPSRPEPEGVEDSYNRMAGYGFARRYVEGKLVADLDPRGTGAHILAETAGSVTSLITSSEALKRAREAYPASNLTFALGKLPELPFPEASFDVAIALGVMEGLRDPDLLVAEARRVLKTDGIFIVSAPDKQALSNRRARGLYAGDPLQPARAGTLRRRVPGASWEAIRARETLPAGRGVGGGDL